MFADHDDAATDEILVRKAQEGHKQSLEQLIKRHQDYIYNISLKLYLNPDDALDATQEVLIKVVTSLNVFRGQSQFRTWLYRITVNHFLNLPKKKMELLFDTNPNAYAGFAQAETDMDTQVTEEQKEEVRIMCSTAMLMCLNREQRLIYIIGEIFGAGHTLGAALFDTTTANYRVKLHRAKSDLLNFTSGKCGLIDERNPCRCSKKAKSMISQGIVDKDKNIFNTDYQQRISALVANQKNEINDEIQMRMKELFLDSPFQIKTQLNDLMDGIVR